MAAAVHTPPGLEVGPKPCVLFRGGGLRVGIALVFIAAVLMKGMQRFGLVAIILVMASLILARTTAAFLDRSF